MPNGKPYADKGKSGALVFVISFLSFEIKETYLKVSREEFSKKFFPNFWEKASFLHFLSTKIDFAKKVKTRSTNN